MKSNENAKHDGIILQCPITSVNKNFIYQKVVNNKVKGGIVQDIRFAVCRNKIPLVYLKYREVEKRFSNINKSVKISKPQYIFSSAEVKKILIFSQAIGIDWGEIDALRDKNDGKLYLIDVNNTPAGPPNHLSKKDKEKALNLLTAEFNRSFCQIN